MEINVDSVRFSKKVNTTEYYLNWNSDSSNHFSNNDGDCVTQENISGNIIFLLLIYSMYR